MTRLERPHARLLSDLRPAYHNDETGEMQYRYYDDTVCIYNEDNIPADDVLDFILAAKRRKRELGPDGYWRPLYA